MCSSVARTRMETRGGAGGAARSGAAPRGRVGALTATETCPSDETTASLATGSRRTLSGRPRRCRCFPVRNTRPPAPEVTTERGEVSLGKGPYGGRAGGVGAAGLHPPYEATVALPVHEHQPALGVGLDVEGHHVGHGHGRAPAVVRDPDQAAVVGAHDALAHRHSGGELSLDLHRPGELPRRGVHPHQLGGARSGAGVPGQHGRLADATAGAVVRQGRLKPQLGGAPGVDVDDRGEAPAVEEFGLVGERTGCVDHHGPAPGAGQAGVAHPLVHVEALLGQGGGGAPGVAGAGVGDADVKALSVAGGRPSSVRGVTPTPSEQRVAATGLHGGRADGRPRAAGLGRRRVGLRGPGGA